MSDEMKVIPLSQIRENPAALRKVDKERPEYLELVESIKQRGVIQAITVRQMRDSTTNEDYYSLVDGLHRFTGSVDAGKNEIPARIITGDEAEALSAQIITNSVKIETRPVEYSKALQRLMAINPTMTRDELALKVNKSPSWLANMLGLSKLHPEIQKLVDDATIKVNNAFILCKLPAEEQLNYITEAQTKSLEELAGIVTNRSKELRTAARQGRDADNKFVPVAHLRKNSEIKSELDTAEAGNTLLAQAGNISAAEAFKLAIQWALHLDPISLKVAEDAHNAKVAQQKQEREERDKKRALEKQAKAEKAAAEAKEAAAKLGASVNG